MTDRVLAQRRRAAYREGYGTASRRRYALPTTPLPPSPSTLVLPESFKNQADSTSHIFTPQSFDEYIGQAQAKELAIIMMLAANKEKRPLPNVIIAGASGLGKTTLGKLMLKDQPYTFIDGNAANKQEEFQGYIIIDEIHNIKPEICDALNVILDDGHVRIIGCTTNPGMLPAAFRSRFRILTLTPYSVDDLTAIQRNAVTRKKNVSAPTHLLEEISKRGRFTPRRTLQYLQFVFDLMSVADQRTITPTLLKLAFEKIGVDEQGLLDIDHRYLKALRDDQPVGLQYLEAVLGIDKKTIEEEIEPYLMQKGLMDRKSRGRISLSLEPKLHASLEELGLFKDE